MLVQPTPSAYPSLCRYVCPARFDSIVKYLSDEFRINFVVSPLKESWIGPKPTNRLFRLLYSPILSPLPPDLYFEGWNERKTRRSLDNGGGFLEKKKKTVSTDLVDRSPPLLRFDSIANLLLLLPLPEKGFDTISNLYISTCMFQRSREAKQRLCIRFQIGVWWIGSDSGTIILPPSPKLVAILGDFTPLRQRSGF